MSKIGCFYKDTAIIPKIREILTILAGVQIAENGGRFTVGQAFSYLRKKGLEIDLETVSDIYENSFDLTDGNFNSQEEVDEISGRVFENTLDNLIDMEPKVSHEVMGLQSPGKAVAKTLTGIFRNAHVTDIKTRSMLKVFENKLEAAAKALLDKSGLPETSSKKPLTYEEIVAAAFDNDTHGIMTVRGSINSAKQLYEELQKEIAKYIRGLIEKEDVDEDYIDAFEQYTQKLIDKGYSLLLSSPELKKIINGALIDAGFYKEITKNGVKEKILSWTKLTDGSGSPTFLEDNVSEVFRKLGYDEYEISRINDALEDEYIKLREKIAQKKIDNIKKEAERAKNNLVNRNKTRKTQQQAQAKRLAKLYTLGLFEATPKTYENILNSLFGMNDFDAATFQKLKVLGMGLQTFYATKLGTANVDLYYKSGIADLNEQIADLVRQSQNNNLLGVKIMRAIQTIIDASFRFMLTSIKNMGLQNPLSGAEANFTANVKSRLLKETTPELNDSNRELMKSVFKDMVYNGGIHYGDINTTFVNRGRLDEYVNKLSDNQIYHAVIGTLIGRTGLDAMDSKFKANITQKYFEHNILKVLMEPTKERPAMTKEEALKYMVENVTGDKYVEAETMAENLIKKINDDAGEKILNDTPNMFGKSKPFFVKRLAHDIVNAQLVAGGAITDEQLEAAYNSAYRAAGRELGHVPNNLLSLSINAAQAAIQASIDKHVKNKEGGSAMAATAAQIVFRNFMNPFVGGATNWIVLKAEKSGLGLVTGLTSLALLKSGFKPSLAGDGKWYQNLFKQHSTRMDLTTDAGMAEMERILYEEQKAWNKVYRGAVGAVTSAIMYGIFWAALKEVFGGDDDEANRRRFNKWRKDNYWLSKYTDEFTPEWLLAQMAAENDSVAKYMNNTMGWNNNYSSVYHFQEASKAFDKGKSDKGWYEIGLMFGAKVNLPIPSSRFAFDIVELYQGFTGTLPKSEWNQPIKHGSAEAYMQGLLKSGFMDKTGISDELGLTPKSKK